MKKIMPEFEYTLEIRKQLSFFEVNLLMENINQKTTKESLVSRLVLLSQNTKDERLLLEIRSLISLVQDLTPAKFEKLKQDTFVGHTIFPADYSIS